MRTVLLGIHEEIVCLNDILVGERFQDLVLNLQVVNELGVTPKNLDGVNVPGRLLHASSHRGLGTLSNFLQDLKQLSEVG